MIHIVAGRGRCYIASEALPSNSLVIEEEPYAMITRSAYAEVCCNLCGKLCVDGTVFTVSAEDRFRYCSEACITADYPTHQHEIKVHERLLGTPGKQQQQQQQPQFGDADPSALIVRIAAKRKVEPAVTDAAASAPPVVMANGPSNRFQDIMKLEAASSCIPEAALSMLQKASHRLSVICNLGGLSLSQPEAYHLFLSQQCNAHQILDSAGNPIALGLFPLTSMLNHSCVPNCAHSFVLQPGRPPRLVMRTIRDVAAGEELVYNYTQLYASTSRRRLALEQCYSFVCECQRCKEGDDAYIDNEGGSSSSLRSQVVASTLELSSAMSVTSDQNGAGGAKLAESLLGTSLRLLFSGDVHAGNVAIVQASVVLLRWTQRSLSMSDTSFLAEVACLASLSLGSMANHCCLRFAEAAAPVRIHEIERMCSDVLGLLDAIDTIAPAPAPATSTVFQSPSRHSIALAFKEHVVNRDCRPPAPGWTESWRALEEVCAGVGSELRSEAGTEEGQGQGGKSQLPSRLQALVLGLAAR